MTSSPTGNHPYEEGAVLFGSHVSRRLPFDTPTRVTARRAEELVVTEVMKSAPAVLRSEIAGLYSNLRDEHYWADATTAERRHVLATVIDKVVLIPRPEGTAHGKGQPRDRELRLIWKPEFVSAEGERDSASEPFPEAQSTSKVCEECGLRKRLIDFSQFRYVDSPRIRARLVPPRQDYRHQA
jgi:hypothetical protein